MAATIGISLLEDGTTVRLQRGEGIDNNLWLQVRAEWGSPNREADRYLIVPVEAFLARMGPFARRAKAAGAAVALNEDLRELVRKARATRTALDQRLADRTDLTEQEAVARLEGSRFTRDLRDFQERDLGRLLALAHGANFSVPGAGKTTVAYATYEALRHERRVRRLLVVAPLSAFDAWEEEAKDCFDVALKVTRLGREALTGETEVALVNYQRLDREYPTLVRYVTEEPTMVILDEAHRMKRGWGGTWGTHCLNLAYLAERRDILTGTPAPQGPGDFVALLDYLWPGQALRILPGDALVARPTLDVGPRVADAIRPLFVRATKGELELPPVNRHVIPVDLEPLHRDIYHALRNRYAGMFRVDRRDELDLLGMGRVVMYMLEAATNPKLLTAGSHGDDPDVFRHPPLDPEPGSRLAELIADYNRFETPSKFQQLVQMVKANADEGRKTLVWTNFVRNLLTLRRMLAVYQPAVIHGGVPPYAAPGEVSREVELNRFRNNDNCMVLLANPAAMSEGISLHHDCHDAIYLERTFNAGQYLQSIDRIHRLGLEPDVETNITFLVSRGTIDETVAARVGAKAALLGRMLEDADLTAVALPNDEDYGPPLESDEADLTALFAHLRCEDEDSAVFDGGGPDAPEVQVEASDAHGNG
jgi:SNF2 family DNA or RNA helicase